jgi:acylphosphatase
VIVERAAVEDMGLPYPWMPEPPVRRRIRATGRVQGVFFRDATRREAERNDVAGWASNRPDGSVEAVFEGPPEAVEALVEFARAGPGSAKVEALDVETEEPEGLRGFDVR